MTYAYGWRLKFGIVTPSTNTTLEPDLESIRPDGVTNHYARMTIGNIDTDDEAGFNAMLRQVNDSLEAAVDQIMTCEPGHLILGISGESVWGGGFAAVEAIRKRILSRSGGVGVTQPADALPAALEAYGVRKRIAILTPYHPSADKSVRELVTAMGYEVVKSKHTARPKPTMIAATPESDLRAWLREVDGPEVEAIVQLGANFPLGRLADEAERWLGKPVIAINKATYWHALRRNGILDRRYGHGRLMWEF
ncbi:MAG: IgiC [Alphaproteobacteria bacterium]|nr:IgiC [Alphaproteobacteria bacterium]